MGLVRLFLALVVEADHWRVIALAPVSPFMDDRLKLGFNAGYAVMFFDMISGLTDQLRKLSSNGLMKTSIASACFES